MPSFIAFSPNKNLQPSKQPHNNTWQRAFELEKKADEAFKRFENRLAKKLYREAIKTAKKAVGGSCLTTAKIYTKLADVFEKTGNNLKAFTFYTVALSINLEIQPRALKPIQEITKLFFKTGYFFEKQNLIKEALNIYQKAVIFFSHCDRQQVPLFSKKIAKMHVILVNHTYALVWLRSIDLSLETEAERREILDCIDNCLKQQP